LTILPEPSLASVTFFEISEVKVIKYFVWKLKYITLHFETCHEKKINYNASELSKKSKVSLKQTDCHMTYTVLVRRKTQQK
jgi:hypothetical protein